MIKSLAVIFWSQSVKFRKARKGNITSRCTCTCIFFKRTACSSKLTHVVLHKRANLKSSFSTTKYEPNFHSCSSVGQTGNRKSHCLQISLSRTSAAFTRNPLSAAGGGGHSNVSPWSAARVTPHTIHSDPGYMSRQIRKFRTDKFDGLTNGNFDSCNSCKRLVTRI